MGRKFLVFSPWGRAVSRSARASRTSSMTSRSTCPRNLSRRSSSAADVRIERIISHGHASPADFWYDQAQHEWVIVLKGAARLQFEDGTRSR